MHCKVVCQQGAFAPIGNPESKESAIPLKSQPVLKSVYANRENGVCIYTSQNAKIPTVDPPARRGKTVGILGVAFIGTEEIHASQSAHRITGGCGCVGRCVIFLVGKRMQ